MARLRPGAEAPRSKAIVAGETPADISRTAIAVQNADAAPRYRSHARPATQLSVGTLGGRKEWRRNAREFRRRHKTSIVAK